MGATITHATPITPESSDHAGNFNIAQYSNFRTIGSTEGNPGYYKSTMPNLAAFLIILKKIKSETINPNLETGNIYFGESTVQLMVWGVVYDFMSFCTNLFGQNFEEPEMSIAESRIQLTTEIAECEQIDFSIRKLKSVFLSIAKCANGILANAYISQMINNPDEDSEDEYDINQSNSLNEANTNEINEPPHQKRQCNRMSVYPQSK